MLCSSRDGYLPSGSKSYVRALALGVSLACAGCASQRASHHQASHAGVPPYQTVQTRVDMEADGLPAQAPPPLMRRAEPDDPSEPYSPNYGGPPNRMDRTQRPAERDARVAPHEPYKAFVPAPIPIHGTPRDQRPPVRLSRVDTDDVMLRAIAAHEQRYR